VSNHIKLFTTCNLQLAVSKLARLAVPNVFALESMAGAYPRGQVQSGRPGREPKSCFAKFSTLS